MSGTGYMFAERTTKGRGKPREKLCRNPVLALAETSVLQY